MLNRRPPLVVGLGQCSLDLLGQISCYPDLDQKAELKSLLTQGGGPVSTALVTLSRLGVPVAMAGVVGDDHYGEQIRSGLLSEGVDCTHLTASAGSASQVAFIAVDDEGHRNIFCHRGTASFPPGHPLSPLFSPSVQVLHLDGLHLEATFAAAELARSLGVTTVLDAGSLRPGINEILPLIDHLIVSETFARQFIHRDDPDAALQSLAAFGAKAVTVTLGKSGSLSLNSDGARLKQPAFAVCAVDTTGCGDVFHGGYIYGLLQNWPLAQRLRFAAACAALKTRALGGRTAIPDLLEVETFLQEAAGS